MQNVGFRQSERVAMRLSIQEIVSKHLREQDSVKEEEVNEKLLNKKKRLQPKARKTKKKKIPNSKKATKTQAPRIKLLEKQQNENVFFGAQFKAETLSDEKQQEFQTKCIQVEGEIALEAARAQVPEEMSPQEKSAVQLVDRKGEATTSEVDAEMFSDPQFIAEDDGLPKSQEAKKNNIPVLSEEDQTMEDEISDEMSSLEMSPGQFVDQKEEVIAEDDELQKSQRDKENYIPVLAEEDQTMEDEISGQEQKEFQAKCKQFEYEIATKVANLQLNSLEEEDDNGRFVYHEDSESSEPKIELAFNGTDKQPLELNASIPYASTPQKFNKGSMKIVSWCVDNSNMLANPNVISFLLDEAFDILCLQGLNCSNGQLPIEFERFAKKYKCFWNLESYGSGIVILSRYDPDAVSVTYEKELDANKSVLVMIFSLFTLLCVAAPSAGFGLNNLDNKLKWYDALSRLVQKLWLSRKKRILIVGNLETAHREIDIANSKHKRKTAGFTREECNKLDNLLQTGMVDTDIFRHFHPKDENAFTVSQTQHLAETPRKGESRMDYFLASKNLIPHIKDSSIQPNVDSSIHNPIVLFLNFP